MAGVQYKECPLCGKTTGARFVDENLPCPYCKGDKKKALAIKLNEEKEIKIYFRVLAGLFVVIVLIILNI